MSSLHPPEPGAVGAAVVRRIGTTVATALLVVVAASIGSAREHAVAEREGALATTGTVVQSPASDGAPSWVLWAGPRGDTHVAPVLLANQATVGDSVHLTVDADGVLRPGTGFSTEARTAGIRGAALVLLVGGVTLLLANRVWRWVEAAQAGRRLDREWRAVERQWREQSSP